jgi:hypothetical protein
MRKEGQPMFGFFKKQAQPGRLDWRDMEVEQTGSSDVHCSCCDETTRVVWGGVRSSAGTQAAYFVGWTLNRPNNGARFDLIIGKWGAGAESKDRQLVSLEYRVADKRGAFMVVDSVMRPEIASLASTALRRNDVIGKPVAEAVFSIADAILAKEERIQEIRDWSL